MLNFFYKESNNPQNLPPLPPFYSDVVEAEILGSSQVPVMDSQSLVSFMMQDCVQYYQQLENLEKSFFVQLLRTNKTGDNLHEIQLFSNEILRHKQGTKDLIQRLCAVTTAGFLEIPPLLITEIQRTFGNVLTSTANAHITTEDAKRIIRHYNQTPTFMAQVVS